MEFVPVNINDIPQVAKLYNDLTYFIQTEEPGFITGFSPSQKK